MRGKGVGMREGAETDIRRQTLKKTSNENKNIYFMQHLYQPEVGCKVNGFIMSESKCFSREFKFSFYLLCFLKADFFTGK